MIHPIGVFSAPKISFDYVAQSRENMGAPGKPREPRKLTHHGVLEIRTSKESLAVLAKKYGIDKSYVWLIKVGKRRQYE